MFNIFQKISEFIKKLFQEEDEIKALNPGQETIIENNIIDEMRKKQQVLNLQEEYEKGIIFEQDLSEDVKKEIIKLYKEQIKTLKENIDNQKKELQEYKSKIVAKRTKVTKKD